MKRPILIALVGYIIGILWELYFKQSIALFVIICFGIFLIFNKSTMHYALLKDINNKTIIIILISMLVSNYITIYKNNKYENLYRDVNNESNFIATVISDKNQGEYSSTYILKVESINGDKKYKNTQILLKISDKYNIKLKYGDKISFKGVYSAPEIQRNYKGFDYSKYLRSQKIFGIVTYSGDKINVLKSKNLSLIKIVTNKISNNMKDNIKEIFNIGEADFLIGILLGDNKNIDEETKKYFRNSGLYHILAVSGTHMSYIVLGLTLMLDKIKISKNKKRIIKILTISFFILLTNNAISVVRAGMMTILVISAQILYRKSDIINNICFSMLIILVDNPYNIINISFQLSYGGVIGIVMLNESYLKLLKNFKIREKLLKAISVILSAQTMIIPIMILNYHTISLNFLISNLLASPIIGATIILGFITLFVSFISIKVSSLFALIVSMLIKILIMIAKYCGNLPFSQIFVRTPHLIIIVLYYITIIMCIKIAKNNERNQYLIRIYKFRSKILQALIVVIIIVVGVYNYIPKDLKIYFIDVGQGDSTLIVTPNNKKILIDGGGNEVINSTYDVGENTLLPYLLDRRIDELDFIMISHFDADHCEGIIAVLRAIKVKNIIISKQIENNDNYMTIMNIAVSKNVNIIVVKSGDVINVDKDVDIRIIYPRDKLYFEDLNNNSIVAKLIYNNFNMLFTGDIEKIAEDKIVELYSKELQATILKVPHHGSQTSSTEEFLLYVKPQVALIGVGKDNKFGHPSNSVIERLNNKKVEIYRTDLNGEIEISINGKGKYKINTKISD